VTLLERTRFPRHHVGESLQPTTFSLLERHFGLDVSAAGFARITTTRRSVRRSDR